MQLTLDDRNSPLLIRALGDGKIRIGNTTYERSVLIAGGKVRDDWPVNAVSDLRPEHWESVLAHGPSILILGTGKRLEFPEPSQTAALAVRRIGVEVMDTAAACRTFNVLLSEGRSVAAAIIL